MNAIADNAFTRALGQIRHQFPTPKAILCVSAHWMTEGTWVTAMPKPKTIHDFYGFPPALSQIQYPAPGSLDFAQNVRAAVGAHLDTEMWGLDHGAWAVLRHIYPNADVPVLQLSLHLEKPIAYHFELGKKLRALRDAGVLIIGSGNVVHNLRTIKWEKNAEPYPWAREFDEWIKAKLLARDFDAIIHRFAESEAGRLSVPTTEHYLPLLYVLGAVDENDALRFEYEEIQNGSISMRSLSFGAK